MYGLPFLSRLYPRRTSGLPFLARRLLSARARSSVSVAAIYTRFTPSYCVSDSLCPRFMPGLPLLARLYRRFTSGIAALAQLFALGARSTFRFSRGSALSSSCPCGSGATVCPRLILSVRFYRGSTLSAHPAFRFWRGFALDARSAFRFSRGVCSRRMPSYCVSDSLCPRLTPGLPFLSRLYSRLRPGFPFLPRRFVLGARSALRFCRGVCP